MEYWSTLIGMGMLILFMHGMVNEAYDEVKPDGLRNSYWYQIIG